MLNQQLQENDAFFAQINEALKRASQKARELSAQTNTPFIIFKDGKIIDLQNMANEKETSEKHSIQ